MLEARVRSALVKFKGKLDGLIMCHGVFHEGNIRETNLKDWDRLMLVNVRSVVAMASLCTNFLKAQDGCITIMTSIHG